MTGKERPEYEIPGYTEPADIAAMNECLRTAFEADPAAMHALCSIRVPCRAALADHPHVVVDKLPIIPDGGYFAVGAIGLINGLLSAQDSAWQIGSCWDTDEMDEDGRPKFKGIRIVARPKR